MLKVFLWFPERNIQWNPSPPARWLCGYLPCSLAPSTSLHLPTRLFCSLSNVTLFDTQGWGPGRSETFALSYICLIQNLSLDENVPDSPRSVLSGGFSPVHCNKKFIGACRKQDVLYENICTHLGTHTFQIKLKLWNSVDTTALTCVVFDWSASFQCWWGKWRFVAVCCC